MRRQRRTIGPSFPFLASLSVAGGAYEGPGDIAPNARAWFGFRAYSESSIGMPVVRIFRVSDSAEQDFVALADGSLDIASINTFLAATTGRIDKLYDQTGNGAHISKPSPTLRPFYQPNASGSLPGMSCTFDIQEHLISAAGAIPAQAQPFSFSWLAKKTGNFTSAADVVALLGDAITVIVSGLNVTINTARFYVSGSSGMAVAADNVFHAVQMLANGASSIISVDGSDTTGLNAGSLGVDTDNVQIGINALNSNDIMFLEGGYWPSNTSATFADLTINQETYWGI